MRGAACSAPIHSMKQYKRIMDTFVKYLTLLSGNPPIKYTSLLCPFCKKTGRVKECTSCDELGCLSCISSETCPLCATTKAPPPPEALPLLKEEGQE